MVWRHVAGRLFSPPLTVPAEKLDEREIAELAERLHATARRTLGRSLSIRQVDAGSCNGCELEINMLNSVVYDLERFGLHFVASPRHADVMMVTGPTARNMREGLLRTHAAAGEPKFVVAVGDCAIDGGVFKGSYAVDGAVANAVQVDLVIRGCPPSPAQMLVGLRLLLEANAGP